MTSAVIRYLCVIAFGLISFPSLADWLVAASQRAVRPSPNEAEVMAQNPPSFRWSRHPSLPPQYELELIAPDGQRKLVQSSTNWYLPDSSLAVGRWAWRVRPSASTTWSDLRHFTLSTEANLFLVPETPILRKRVLEHARPRSLQIVAGGADDWAAMATAQRPAALKRLQEQVTNELQLPSVSDRDFPLDISGRIDWTKLVQIRKAYTRITRVGQQAESAALLYRLTRNQAYLTEATRRAAELAALDPAGVTAHTKDDQTSRRIGLSLAIVADQLSDTLSAATRAAWWNAVGQRAAFIYADLAKDGGHLAQYPYQSHAGVNLAYLAAMATLSLGEQTAASQWFDFSVRQHFHHAWPYSGSEGGYADGTAYAQYIIHDALRIWPILHNATGVNLFAKPWSEGMVNYFSWFVPPGTPTHMFGSDAESRPVPWLLKAFASRVGTPAAKWYVRNLIGEEDALMYLQAPYPLPVDAIPLAVPPPSAAWVRSIGWVAMHSSLPDRGRTSVYFKSSPFGSYGHSHADQNSFVIHSAGRALLTDSGVYDWYGSAHFTGWYRRTEAHNAVTFDGGQGQFSRDSADGSFAAVGNIQSAVLTPPLYRVEGDATQAYTGALTKARRTLWYAPALGWVIIRDQLAAPLPHRFELNLHALAPFVENGSGYRVTNDGVSACIDVLSPQQLAQGIVSSGYPVPPDGLKPAAAHALRMSTRESVNSTELWMGIRVGCTGSTLTLTQIEAGRMHVANNESALDLK
ncbi:heparinase II/III family protein [Rhodoferax sp.]|uniref:heparinase II/III domain-containing protein n=1 Tax=Rhodoferax sp. TaxID=50421 RepID=UPI001ED0D1D5|nr:heparinase II/III family protein [Rhodoferax sp.]MBT9507774.1 heparinase II/III family protein [Rhodoferax sp.]